MSKKEVCCNCCERLLHTDIGNYCSVDGMLILNPNADMRTRCSGEFKRVGKVRYR